MSAINKNPARWLILITIIAFLIRLPYWQVIPASFDEVNQTVYALLIAQGHSLPLVGNDAYAGPFYVYLIAMLLRLGLKDPVIGRAVIMVAGTLTIPVTYGWTQALSKNKIAALTAALLVALSPDLILINSHMGGTTFLLPFFTTLLLMSIALAVRQDSVKWLIAAGVIAGIALQLNPVAGLLIMGSSLWLLWQAYHKEKLGKWWPFWPILFGVIVILMYTPVIIHNLTADFQTIDAMHERSYLWQDSPTIETTVTNLRRLSFQTVRQVSGVLIGSEDFSTLVGIPLLYLTMMVIGLAYTSYRVSLLPLFVFIPFWIVVPVFSDYYGFTYDGRFTTLLIPIWAATIGIIFAVILNKIKEMAAPKRTIAASATVILTVLLLTYPVVSLFQYYKTINEDHGSGEPLLALSRYAATHNQGEPIYISPIHGLAFLRGIPDMPHATFLLYDVHHEFLPPQQIIGRLYENPGPAYFLLTDDDAELVQTVIPLKRVEIPANDDAQQQNYGLYERSTIEPLLKPDFVLKQQDIPDDLAPAVIIGEGIQLLGCDTPDIDLEKDNLSLACYWQAVEPMPSARYIGFVHLSDPATATLVTQNDHVLGQERYPLKAWGVGEVVKELYVLDIPEELASGEYQLSIGIYTWPELFRLSIADDADDMVALPSIYIGE